MHFDKHNQIKEDWKGKKEKKKLLIYHKFVDAPQLCKYDVNMIGRRWITRKINQSAPPYLWGLSDQSMVSF